jgi:uncharacterized cysteine cluster protein YcgN (CxxCxxCC family)
MSFWKTKPLAEMTPEEWESLCDGCGKCCLEKLFDEDTEDLHYTDVACKLLDCQTCRCTNYEERAKFVPSCLRITVESLDALAWLPDSCAYERLYQGRDLPSWHPLITGSDEALHRAGMSVKGRIISETEVEDLRDHVAEWPLDDVD